MSNRFRLVAVRAVTAFVSLTLTGSAIAPAGAETTGPDASRTAPISISVPTATAAATVATVATTAAAAPARCTKPAPTTAAGYQAMFNAKNDYTWSGGDQASSVKLPDGRVLWLFADTIQGTQTAKGGYAPGWRMVHNSFVIQDRGCLKAVNGRLGAEVIPNPKPGQFYWPQHAVVEGGKLLVFVGRVRAAGKGTFGFAGLGVDIAVFKLSPGGAPRFERVVRTVASNAPETSPHWGQAVTSDSRFTYLYGSAKVNRPYHFGKSVYVARVPKGKVLTSSAWTYWDGKRWNTKAALAAPIVKSSPAGWSTSFTVHRTPGGRYQMVTKENDVLGTDVVTGVSASPVGPFTRRVVTRKPSYSGAIGKDLFYNAMGHRELPVKGGFLGHISSNSASTDLKYLARDADKYKPQFFTVPAL